MPMSREVYLKLLKRARANLPRVVEEHSRFTMPTVKVEIFGNQTHILNFKDIADKFNRNYSHLGLFISREVGAPYILRGEKLILSRKVKRKLIQQKIEKYAKLYVFCPVCGKPDTVLEKKDRIIMLKCHVCGAISPVPRIGG